MATRTAKPAQAKFVVDLGGMSLSAEDQRSLAAAIQGAVLSFLAPRVKLPGKAIRLTSADDGGVGGGIAGMIIDAGGIPGAPSRPARAPRGK